MSIQTKKENEKLVFGEYQVSKRVPFTIAQAPFRKYSKYQREGHWNQKERLKYTVFLEFFYKLLKDEDLKKNARIYQMMSDMIITRNPSQCRSHHQKMQKHRHTIEEIITSVTEKYQPSVYEENKEKYTVLIKTLLQNLDKYIRQPTSIEKRKDKIRKTPSMKSSSKIKIKNTKGQIFAQGKANQIAYKKTAEAYSDDEEQKEKKEQKKDRIIEKAFKPSNTVKKNPRADDYAYSDDSQEIVVKKEKTDSYQAQEEVNERLDEQFQGFKEKPKALQPTDIVYQSDEEMVAQPNHNSNSRQPLAPQPQINLWNDGQLIFIPYMNVSGEINRLQKQTADLQVSITNFCNEYTQKLSRLNYLKTFCNQTH